MWPNVMPARRCPLAVDSAARPLAVVPLPAVQDPQAEALLAVARVDPADPVAAGVK